MRYGTDPIEIVLQHITLNQILAIYMTQAQKSGYEIDQSVHVQSLKLFKLFGGDASRYVGELA